VFFSGLGVMSQPDEGTAGGHCPTPALAPAALAPATLAPVALAPTALLWTARVVGLAALALTLYLALASMRGAVAGCGPDAASACGELLTGRWSRFVNVPVTTPAALLYLGAVIALFSAPRWAQLFLGAAAPLFVIAACWFLGLQIALGAFCPYCIVVHCCGLLLAAFTFWCWRPSLHRWTLGLGALGGALLVAGQIAAPPLPRSMQTVRLTAATGSSVSLNAEDFPRLGSGDAKTIVVLLFNYNCRHCQVMERYLEQALDRYGSQLAVLALVVPLHPDCNVYVKEGTSAAADACDRARLALAVWNTKPQEFAAFHRWLIETSPTLPSARNWVEERLGPDKLAKALQAESVRAGIDKNVQVYAAFGGGQLPKLIHGRDTAVGEPASVRELFDFLETKVGLKQRGAASLPSSGHPPWDQSRAPD
jgi:uncharacterized membrane protein/protein-disulfide isomerase